MSITEGRIIGQKKNVKLIKVIAPNAVPNKMHTLLLGPSGHGKTFLARHFLALAEKNGYEWKYVLGDKATTIMPPKNGVLFIDEIHMIPSEDQESLYPIMDTYNCCIIAATTDLDMLKEPLRNRFKLQIEIEPYSFKELLSIASLYTTNPIIQLLAVHIGQFVPRQIINTTLVLNQLCQGAKTDKEIYTASLALGTNILGIDRRGLALLEGLAHGQPMGIARLSALTRIKKGTIEKDVEPHLLRQGFIISTRSGRQITQAGLYALALSKEMDEEMINTILVIGAKFWDDYRLDKVVAAVFETATASSGTI